MKPVELKNVFALTKNQMLPLKARLTTSRKRFRPSSPKQQRPLPKKIQEINKES